MRYQRGATLITTVIILAILAFASVTLFRSTDVTTLIAGNIAYKQAAQPIADNAIEQAIDELNAQTDFNNDIPGRYYATQQPNDINGLPLNVNWSQIPARQIQNFTVQHVTERLCTEPLGLSDMNAICSVGQATANSSYKINAPVYANGSIFYRTTVRVTGPKNTLSFVQAIIER